MSEAPVNGAEPPKSTSPLGGTQAIDQLKSVTQNLKSVTAPIPQQAILHKTGIIADPGLTEAQKAAAKARTSRISLSDAMGAAPVKAGSTPMKTIRIKRPTDIPGATATLKRPGVPPPPVSAAAEAPVESAPATEAASGGEAPSESATVTQRKTLKITRPGTAVRPAGKFGIKKPASTSAETVAKEPAAPAEDGAIPEIADIPDVPAMPAAPVPAAVDGEKDVPKAIGALSLVVQLAACAAMGFLAYKLFEATSIATF